MKSDRRSHTIPVFAAVMIRRHHLGIVMLLCGMLCWSGCVQSYETALETSQEYPCTELARVQHQYDRLKKQGSPESDLRQLRRQLKRLQQRCTTYRNAVVRHMESSGYTRATAERKAAEVPRSVPLTYTKQADSGTWLTVGVLAGVVVLGVTGYAIGTLLSEPGTLAWGL